MTPPSDHSTDREDEPRSARAKGTGPSEAKAADSVRVSATSPASAIPTLGGADSIRPRVEDVEARLSALAQRELDLHRREREVARQQRLLEQHAQQVAQKEAEQPRGRLASDEQNRLAEQRAALEETLKALADHEAAYGQRRAEVRRRLAEKLDLIRQRKNEFIEKVQIAGGELKRRKLVLAREQRALDEQVAALEGRRELLEQRAADLEQRDQELGIRAQALERQRAELVTTATELDERGRTLAARAGELASRHSELDTREGESQARAAELHARTREVEQQAETLRAVAAEADARGKTLDAQAAELAGRGSELDARQAELDRRGAVLDTRARELERQAETTQAAAAELDERANAFDTRETELADRRSELDTREVELKDRAGELDARTREIEQRTETLKATAAELDERRETLDAQEAGLAFHGRELETREAELKDRAGELDGRTREIEQRTETLKATAAELDERRETLNAQKAELAFHGRQLDTREAELEGRGDELTARARDIQQRTETLKATAAELDERRETLDVQEAELAGRGSELDSREAQLQDHRRELDARTQELEQHAAVLDERQAELDGCRREAESRESELRDRDDELHARTQQIEAREQELVTRAAECNAESETLRSWATEVERSQVEVDGRFTELETARAQLDEHARALGQREQELSRRETELDEDRRLIDEGQDALARQREDVAVRERAVQERQAALAEGMRQLDERETALGARAAAVEARCDEAAQREAEIETRRVSVDKLYQQAIETKEHAQRQQQEIAGLQRQLKARETELRRESLQTEIGRERIQRDYAALIAEQEKLADLRAEAEPELDRPESEPHEQPTLAAEAVPSIPAASLRRRGLMFCGVAGLAAALIWLAVEQPRYRGLAEIQITSERGSPEWIANQHADWLTSDAIAQHWQGPPPVATWMTARAGQHVSFGLVPESGTLRLTLDTPDETLAETLLPAAVKTYITYVGDLPLERFRSPRLIEWSERKSELEGDLERRHDCRDEIQARLAQLPASSARNEAQTAFETAFDEFKHVVARLTEQRDELTVLRSQELPRGEVSAEAYQQTLADDALYQEDLKEFGSEARQYRTELAVSMVLLVDPLQELRKSVQALVATITEQRDMQPPPSVRIVLEQSLVEADDFERFLAEFSQTWDRRRETIERLKAPEQVVELVGQQNVAADAAHRLVAENRRVLAEIKARVDALTEKDNSGTREIVVAAVLRGNLTRLSEQLTTLEENAGATDTAVNFRLDAHGRQLAGLRTRLRDRQQTVREMLQAEADQAARAERNGRERQLREGVGELEEQQRTLIDTVVAQLERRDELDERHQELRELSTELRDEEAAIARLEERLAELEAERPVPQRDEVELVGSRCEQIAGVNRLRNASLTGAATFAATGLLFLLVFVPGAQRKDA